MNPLVYITTALGSCITLILIFSDYISKFNTDNFQRKLFFVLLLSGFIAVVADFFNHFFQGWAGSGIRNMLYVSVSLLHISQNFAYYFGFIFIDYLSNKNADRSKKIIFFITIFISAHIISVIANLFTGFYFTISPDNYIVPGNLHFFRIAISLAPVVLIIINILITLKRFKHINYYLIIFFVLIVGIGGILDIVLRGSGLRWPAFAAMVLYVYFFILQYDSKIDSLTRLGNRYSLNEFIEKLSLKNTKSAYSIVMMDLDRFKEINDTIGHLEGDNALRDISAIIKGVIRREDFAARYGGDEFILATDAKYDIQRVMDRIQDAITLQNEKRVRPYQLHISYGCGIFTTNSGQSIQEFLAEIDALMFKHKEQRKKEGVPSSITQNLPPIWQEKRENNV